MFILFDLISFIIEYNRLNDTNENKYSFIIINMWFISRCISIDSLNSCFQQQKNKTSYDFCSRKEGSDSLVKR
jgi:hypothetical protein